MALTFGKGNRSIAFNPTSAFPLDARSYFESYQLAAAAAASAEAASSTNTQYYYGQEIVVVENNVASFYIIQPDKTLSKVSGKVEVDTNVFEYINGKLNLYGFSQAVAGAQLTKDSSGKLSWIKPDTTTVEGLSVAVGNLQKDLDENYYTKEETNIAIAAASHLKRKKVDSVDDIDLAAADADQYIYMVPSGLEAEDNKYYEYIVIVTDIVDSEGILISQDKKIEKVGSWEVDLKDYAKTENVNTALKNKVDKIEGYVLIDQEELNRLATVKSYAEPNFISNINTDEFSVVEGKLEVLQIQQNKIIGLIDKLAAIDGTSKELQDKLNQININDINNMKTAVGQLTKDIYGYQDEETGETIPGISNFVIELQKSVVNLQNTANGLDGRLSTVESSIANLDNKYVTISNFNTIVGNMDNLLAQQINIIDEINDINERLTWGEIPENKS